VSERKIYLRKKVVRQLARLFRVHTSSFIVASHRNNYDGCVEFEFSYKSLYTENDFVRGNDV